MTLGEDNSAPDPEPVGTRRHYTTANRTKLFVNSKPAIFGDSLKLLGVQFDRLLHFGSHCAALKRRVWPRLKHDEAIAAGAFIPAA
jgi:hypothetical protein